MTIWYDPERSIRIWCLHEDDGLSFPYRLQKFPLFLSSSYRLQKFADTDRVRVNRRPIRKDFFPDRYDFVPIVFTSSSCKRGLRKGRGEWYRRVHRGGSPLPMNPPRSFKFRFKINGMRAHCVRARFRDWSRACFIACACDEIMRRSFNFQGSDRCRARKTVACVARGGELLTIIRCPGAARADHFGAKRWAQLLFEKVPWRGEELQRPLFSPSKTRSIECRATVFLVAWHTGKESVKGTLLPRLINIVVVRRQEDIDVGLLRTDRPPLTLSWSSGLRRVTTLADEKKVRSFTACDDVYAWWPDSGSGAERQWTTLSKLVWQDTNLTRPKCCILDRFWTFSTSRWENIVDAADLSQSTCCRIGHHQCGKASSQGDYSESSTHVQAVLPTVWLAESGCGYDWTASFGLGSQWGTVSKIQSTNKPHGAGEEQDSKLGNSLTLAFLVSKRVIGHDLIQPEVMRMIMYEEIAWIFV